MNEDKFTGKAEVYSAYRPSYPEELYDCLFAEAGFAPGDAVADVGAGTGLFSVPLARRGCRVFAVEPNADMRLAAERDNKDVPGFSTVDGAAENTTLPAASVERVTTAQAFHWFDPEAFARECRRILVPDGLAAVVYNHRVMDDPVTLDTAEANRRHCPAFTGFSGGFRDRADERLGVFFRDGAFTAREFLHDMPMDESAYVGRALSSSYAPRPGEAAREGYIADLKEVFAKYAENGMLRGRLLCRVYWGKV